MPIFSCRFACGTLALVILLVGPGAKTVTAEEEPGFVPLFNGKDLAGWEGDLKLWKVQDGAIVGDSPGIPHNQFLSTQETFSDFELRLEFRLKEGAGNSGVQFRSRRIPDSTEVSGYQADLGEKYWGCLYDESRRNRILVQAPAELETKLKPDDWNEYVIRAEGDHITLSLNGFVTADYKEPEATIPRSGIIALQVHSGPPLRVDYRKIRIRKLSAN